MYCGPVLISVLVITFLFGKEVIEVHWFESALVSPTAVQPTCMILGDSSLIIY